MMHIIKLIRLPNLLIVALTMYLMRYAVAEPLVQLFFFELQMSHFEFALLTLATVLVTAGGYVINDYFDTKTDLLNRPSTVIVGKHIKRRSAMALHISINTLAVLLGFYVAYQIGKLQFGFIFVFVSGLLWFYSATYKRQFLIGNIIVALLTAMVPLLVVVFEIPALYDKYAFMLAERGHSLDFLFYWMLGFSYFAFLSTLIREIIKDIEDFEGDEAFGRNSLPITLGIFYTKLIVILLIIALIASLVGIYFWFLPDKITLLYFIFALIVPFLALIFFVVRASDKKQYHFASNFTKIIMLMGLGYAVAVYFIIQQMS